ncbi:MAG: PEP-CTERM sorting domain-containing protein [Planctomycetota bacterium]
MNRFANLATVAAVGLAASPAFADLGGIFETVSRGAAGSGYIAFDSFNGALGQVTSAVTAESSGGLTGNVTQSEFLTPPGGILGVGDNSVYHHTSAAEWTISVNNPTAFDFALLHVKEVDGSGLAGVPVLANGNAADKFVSYVDQDGDFITTFFWDNLGDVTSVDFTISTPAFAGFGPPAPGNFDSYDAFAVDTFVPEPTSLALLGLGGLIVVRRRRDR